MLTTKQLKKFFLLCISLAALFFALAYYINTAHPLTNYSLDALREYLHWIPLANTFWCIGTLFLAIPCLWKLFMIFQQGYDNE